MQALTPGSMLLAVTSEQNRREVPVTGYRSRRGEIGIRALGMFSRLEVRETKSYSGALMEGTRHRRDKGPWPREP